VRNHDKTVEKLKYMHHNPVRRCLVARPEDWPRSSFRHYLTGEGGMVEIESDWTAWKREHHEASTPPTFPKPGKGRAPKFVVT
jgi:putative transposase